MRLKEIKPGMVICCKNNAEWNKLEDYFENKGWDERDYIRRLDHSTVIHIDGFNEVRWESKSKIVNGSDITYFSDLIIPELSAAEVPAILYEICEEYSSGGVNCSPDCPFAFHGMKCDQYKAENGQRVAEICEQWKADHEQKELEFEWVDICRIIEVQDNGKKVCVHEEDIKDSELPFGYKECTAELILKEYMRIHRGNYFATVEHVCRVKGEK